MLALGHSVSNEERERAVGQSQRDGTVLEDYDVEGWRRGRADDPDDLVNAIQRN